MDKKIYWLTLGERATRAGAAGALAVLGTGHWVTATDVPWYAVLSGAAIGALTSALGSLASEAAPNTLPASFIPARFAKAPAKRTTVRDHGGSAVAKVAKPKTPPPAK